MMQTERKAFKLCWIRRKMVTPHIELLQGIFKSCYLAWKRPLPWVLGMDKFVPSEEKSHGVEKTVEKPNAPVLKIELIANLTTI